MGKARTFSNEGEEANYLKESEDEIYNSTQQNSYNLGSTTFSDQSGIGNFAQSGTDQRKANLTGALFRGNIGFLLQSAVLDETSKTINLLEDQSGVPVSDVSSDRIVIISGVATTADLEIILGAQRPGQRLVLYNTDGNTITIKDASTAGSPTDPNLIRTPGALDYILSGFDSVFLAYDSDIEQWRIIGAVGTGGGTGYNLIQDEGISLTQRTTMNFIGNLVTAVDNPGQSRTDITINAPAGTVPDGTAENQHLEWDNSFLTWNAVDALTFGTTGPFAASGFLRTANDEIIFASRNAGDSDDIRLKINSSDRFIFEFPGSVVPLEVAVDLIDVKTVDIVNIDRAKFVVSSGSMVPSNATGILLNSNNQFQFNTADTSDFTFTFDNNDPSFVIDRLTASNDSTLVSVLSDETDINSQSFLNITKSFSIPLSLQEIGSLNFIAGNSVGSTLFEYASIIGKIEDTTNGAIDGSMILNATINDAITAFIQLNDSSDGIIKALKDVTLENSSLNPVLTFFRNQTGATDNPLGNIVFKGLQSNNNPFTYSTISSTISDATLGQEDSIITLSTTNNGLLADVQLIVNADSSQILRFASASPTNSFNSPIFEFLTTAGSAPPTGAVQRIGEMNFEATTNNGGGIGAVETFAQIIVDQEESDITNESAGMRFRLRDQTGTAGAIKTYLQFNDGSNESIQALKNIIPFGTTIDLGDDDNRFQDIYLQEAFNASKIIFGTTTDNDTYITGSGFTGRINVFADSGNSIAFDPVGITLFADRYLTMDERLTDPTPLVNSGIFYVKDIAGNAEPWFVGDGTAAQSLLGGGGSGWTDASTNTSSGTKTFENTRFLLRNQTDTFSGAFTFNSGLNPVWTLPSTSVSLFGTPAVQNLDMNAFHIFDVQRLEFSGLGSIPDNDQELITVVPGVGVGSKEMIFQIPNAGNDNDFWKFFSGTYPNNPILIVGRRAFNYSGSNTAGFEARISSNQITFAPSGIDSGVNIGAIGSSLIPKFIFPFVPGTPFLNLGFGNSVSDDSRFWKNLFIKNINFVAPNPTDQASINIHESGNNLFIQTGPLTGNRRDIRFTRTLLGGGTGAEFAKFTDDEDVFNPINQFIVSVETLFNNDVTLGNAIADDISIIGRVDTDIIPKTNNTLDLGSGSNRWQFIHGVSGVFSTVNASVVMTLDNGLFFLLDECSFNIDTTIGTKFGTGTNQKIGFWNATPVVQQTVASDTLANLYTALRNNGIIG